jgi:regulator of replication initiation timing
MISEKELFDRLADLESQKLVLAEDIRQLKADSKYNEDDCPQGLTAEVIKLIAAAAKLEAKRDFEEKKDAANAVFKKYEELSGYND